MAEKEKKLFRESRKEEERAAREAAQEAVREAVPSEVCGTATPDRTAKLTSQSDEDDIPLRELVEKVTEGVASSDDDEPLSVSLRRPTTFKETGLLQPQEQRSDTVTVSSSQPPRASLTSHVEHHKGYPEQDSEENSADRCFFDQGNIPHGVSWARYRLTPDYRINCRP